MLMYTEQMPLDLLLPVYGRHNPKPLLFFFRNRHIPDLQFLSLFEGAVVHWGLVLAGVPDDQGLARQSEHVHKLGHAS